MNLLNNHKQENLNPLFPVFLRLENLHLLIVGAGHIGLEKLQAVIKNSPCTQVTMIGIIASIPIKEFVKRYSNICLIEKEYAQSDLKNIDIAIVAINDSIISEQIAKDIKGNGILCNVADKPHLCDFYLGAIVQKGQLKIAISTNGKSPTLAKRIKELLHYSIPDEINESLNNLEKLRTQLKGDFASKVNQLNQLTKNFSTPLKHNEQASEKKWKRIATYFVLALFFMVFGHIVISFTQSLGLWAFVASVFRSLDKNFYGMLLVGFLAQLVDGLLGMGYGAICTIALLTLGISLPQISASIHTAEMFSSGASGYSHFKFGNVNKKLFKALLIPGIIGAVLGSFLLSYFGEKYAVYIKPLLAFYTLLLGLKILIIAFKKTTKNKSSIKRVGWLAGFGGFLDSFGGGGWGPLVTSTLIAKGRTPRYVIGSVSLTEFFITFASAFTFFTLIGITHIKVIVGLIIGGVVAAPLSAKLAGRLPIKTMFIGVGTLVILWSLRVLLKSM